VRLARALFLVGAIPSLACTVLTSLDGLSGGVTDGGAPTSLSDALSEALGVSPDGFAVDALSSDSNAAESASADASSADGGPINLLTNPSFELGVGGCGPGWNGYGATYTRSNTARTGSYSCMACPTGTGSYQLTAISTVQVGPGSYYAEAWLRTPPGAAAVNAAGTQVYFTADAAPNNYFQANMISPGSTWQVSGEAFLIDAGGNLSFDVHVYYPGDGGCILVDDVALYAQ
jgi:hypothetical protein